MQYPDGARTAALGAAFHWLAIALVDGEILEAQTFLNAMANAGTALMRNDEVLAANALRDLVEPLANHFGFVSEDSG